jgi:5,6,7,8-tetrahydromethanopterin hydro-lyase
MDLNFDGGIGDKRLRLPKRDTSDANIDSNQGSRAQEVVRGQYVGCEPQAQAKRAYINVAHWRRTPTNTERRSGTTSLGSMSCGRRSPTENIMPKITKVGVGEALVGDGNEVAHIDLVVGPRGSPAEVTFYRVLTSQREGVNGLLALIAPNLPARPHTVMFNKVTIKGAKQAEQMFGPAQYAVAKAVTDCVKDGTVPLEEAHDLFVSVGVFIHWDANDNKKIQQFNYEATKLALRRALEDKPTVNEVIEQEDKVRHPLAVSQ